MYRGIAKESICIGLRLETSPSEVLQAFLRHALFLVSKMEATVLQEPLVSLFDHALDKQSGIQVCSAITLIEILIFHGSCWRYKLLTMPGCAVVYPGLH